VISGATVLWVTVQSVALSCNGYGIDQLRACSVDLWIFSWKCYVFVHFHTPSTWNKVDFYNPRFIYRCKYWKWRRHSARHPSVWLHAWSTHHSLYKTKHELL